MLALNNIGITLAGQKIIEQFSLHIKAGQCIVLFGPSGCGKTTILNAISQLLPITTGSIQNHSKQLAYLFQEPRLLPWLTVAENIKFINPMLNQSQLEQQLITLKLAPQDLDKYPAELSGGMKQRVALARALAIQPDLLLMDEPFSALDLSLRLELQQSIIDKIEQGLAVILVTHDIQEAVNMAHYIYILGGNPTCLQQCIEQTTPYSQRTLSWQQRQYQHPLLQKISPQTKDCQ